MAGIGALRLGDIALALQGDWLMVAPQLGIHNPEVIKIQKEYGSITEQVSHFLLELELVLVLILNPPAIHCRPN